MTSRKVDEDVKEGRMTSQDGSFDNDDDYFENLVYFVFIEDENLSRKFEVMPATLSSSSQSPSFSRSTSPQVCRKSRIMTLDNI
ncbi:hypothetical protein E3N88_04461 [Mikania micrantha]|uniref:Uncharacterized protein n=1 Tax=Mikania micrantha TaxID=192012 RepID=A0A5N6PVH6_9ASTR|nr:hypothetical protein E3N88_04461 [Mikania micrantha]